MVVSDGLFFGTVISIGGIMTHLIRKAEEQIGEAWEAELSSNKIV